jgi:hypothetical protein
LLLLQTQNTLLRKWILVVRNRALCNQARWHTPRRDD